MSLAFTTAQKTLQSIKSMLPRLVTSGVVVAGEPTLYVEPANVLTVCDFLKNHTASLDGMPHRVQLYFDASAAHTVNSCWDTSVCRLQPDCIGWPRGWLGCSH